jgi:hypothetical protein
MDGFRLTMNLTQIKTLPSESYQNTKARHIEIQVLVTLIQIIKEILI